MNDKTNTETFLSDENDNTITRRIRSFVLRQGRLTKGQQLAIDNDWPTWGIAFEPNRLLDLSTVFNNTHPVTLEIGFGMGASLVAMANATPHQNFIGIEVHRPGVGACLMAIHEQKVTNLRIMNHDAVAVLETMIADASLDCVQIFFPDPWHKARHNKRRIIQPEFVQLLRRKLKIGGILHLATDWQDYAEHMLATLSAADGYKNLSESNDYIPRPETRPLTKFEQRGHRLGHGVWDLQFCRQC